jgi:hypothetical protein
MADALDSKSGIRKGVWVRVPPPALFKCSMFIFWGGMRGRLKEMVGEACVQRVVHVSEKLVNTFLMVLTDPV